MKHIGIAKSSICFPLKEKVLNLGFFFLGLKIFKNGEKVLLFSCQTRRLCLQPTCQPRPLTVYKLPQSSEKT